MLQTLLRIRNTQYPLRHLSKLKPVTLMVGKPHQNVWDKTLKLRYLREYYVKSLGPDRISWLDTYRLERHGSFYGLDPSELDKQEVKDAIDKTEKFFSSIKDIVGEM